MIAEQNHAGPNRDAFFNGIARNFYWPVKTFPTSRFGRGAFDSRFYGSSLHKPRGTVPDGRRRVYNVSLRHDKKK